MHRSESCNKQALATQAAQGTAMAVFSVLAIMGFTCTVAITPEATWSRDNSLAVAALLANAFVAIASAMYAGRKSELATRGDNRA